MPSDEDADEASPDAPVADEERSVRMGAKSEWKRYWSQDANADDGMLFLKDAGSIDSRFIFL
jgi:hypothetical protein